MIKKESGTLWPWIAWGHVLMVLIAVVLVYFSAKAKQVAEHRVIPAYAKVPGFELIDSNGEPFDSASLEGHAWIADFVYTTCPGPCPMVSLRMSEFQNTVERHPNAKLVTFSVNPEVDTPEKLRDYARSFSAKDRWLFLTGDMGTMHALIRDGFKLAVMKQEEPGAEPVLHSTKLVLVDPQMQIRGYYDSAKTEEMSQLAEDLALVLRGVPNP